MSNSKKANAPKRDDSVYRVSPVGVGKWVSVFKPHTDTYGKTLFKATLVLPAKEGKEFADELMADHEAYVDALKALKTKVGKSTPPKFKEMADGTYEFYFTQTPEIQGKPTLLGVFDNNGAPIVEHVSIGNGSTIQISYRLNQYSLFAKDKFPATAVSSLVLVAIQVINLVKYERPEFKKESNRTGYTADKFGFSPKEGNSSEEAASEVETDNGEDDSIPF